MRFDRQSSVFNKVADIIEDCKEILLKSRTVNSKSQEA